MVHSMQGVGQRPVVQEMSHSTVYGQQALPMEDILRSNKDHYNALLEFFDVTGAQPAWPMYFLVAGKNMAARKTPYMGGVWWGWGDPMVFMSNYTQAVFRLLTKPILFSQPDRFTFPNPTVFCF